MYVGIMFNEFISSHLSACVSVPGNPITGKTYTHDSCDAKNNVRTDAMHAAYTRYSFDDSGCIFFIIRQHMMTAVHTITRPATACISFHPFLCVSVAIICHMLAFVNNILQRCCTFY